MPTGADGKDAANTRKRMSATRPTRGLLLIVPSGNDMMTGETLFKES